MSKEIMRIVRGKIFPPGTRVLSPKRDCDGDLTGVIHADVGTVTSEARYDQVFVVFDALARGVQTIVGNNIVPNELACRFSDLILAKQQLTVEEMLTHYAPLVRRRGQDILRKRNARERARQLVAV